MNDEGNTIDELCEILDLDSSTIKYLELPEEEFSDVLREAKSLMKLEKSRQKLSIFLFKPEDMILLPTIVLLMIYGNGKNLALTLITLAVFIGYVVYRLRHFFQAEEKVFTGFSNREELRDHLMSLAQNKQTLNNN